MSHLSIKLLSPHQNQERNMHRSSIVYKKAIQRSSKQICWWICIREDNRYGLFLLETCYYGLLTTDMLKRLDGFVSHKHSFSLHKMLIDGLEWCGLIVNYCDVFISCLDSFWRYPFTAEDPLVSKLYNAQCLQIYFDEETSSSRSIWMDWGWLHFQQINGELCL